MRAAFPARSVIPLVSSAIQLGKADTPAAGVNTEVQVEPSLLVINDDSVPFGANTLPPSMPSTASEKLTVTVAVSPTNRSVSLMVIVATGAVVSTWYVAERVLPVPPVTALSSVMTLFASLTFCAGVNKAVQVRPLSALCRPDSVPFDALSALGSRLGTACAKMIVTVAVSPDLSEVSSSEMVVVLVAMRF